MVRIVLLHAQVSAGMKVMMPAAVSELPFSELTVATSLLRELGI